MARIVVIGGHGKVALQLARILTERGDEVSSVFRNPDHSDEVAASVSGGGRAVQADIEQLDTNALARLLAGHDAVVFTAGAGGGNPSFHLTDNPVGFLTYFVFTFSPNVQPNAAANYLAYDAALLLLVFVLVIIILGRLIAARARRNTDQ